VVVDLALMKRSVAIRALAAALALAAGGAPALAETIELVGGRQIEGVIVERRDGKLIVLTKGGQLSIPQERVVRVVQEGPGADEPQKIALFLASGRFEEALAGLEAIVDDPVGVEPEHLLAILDALSAEADFIGNALTRRSPSLAARALAMFRRLLDDADLEPEETPASRRWSAGRFRVILARWHWTAGLADEAWEIFEGLDADFYAANPTLAAQATDQLLEALWSALSRRDLDAGERLLELLRPADESAWRAASAMFYIQAGASYRQSNDFARALAIYREKLAPLAPQLAKVHAERTLAIADRTLRGSQEWKTLVALLEEHAPNLLEPARAAELIESALEGGGMRALDEGNAEEALEWFRRLSARRGSGNERFFALAELSRRRARTVSENWLERYKIALYCLEVGLLDEAEREFRAVRQSVNEELAVEAARQLDLLQLQREVELFDKINAASKAGRYYDTLDLAMEFQRLYPLSDLSGQAAHMAELARSEIANAQLRRPYEAEILYQRAERTLFLQEVEEALALLDRVLTEYPETPAAQRAAALKQRAAAGVRARDLERYFQTRRSNLEEFGKEPVSLDGTEAPEAKALREEIAFIARTIGSRLPDARTLPGLLPPDEEKKP
jgi:tetratricopeptide (TPR) repeat protein